MWVVSKVGISGHFEATIEMAPRATEAPVQTAATAFFLEE